MKQLKAQSNQLADQAQAEKFALMNAKQENEQLQDQIVQVRVNEGSCDVLLFGLFAYLGCLFGAHVHATQVISGRMLHGLG